MKYRILYGCAVFVLTLSTTSAQSKSSFSGRCEKPDVLQSLPAGDVDGHIFSIAHIKCSSTGDINGAASKDGVAVEHIDGTAKRARTWGVYTQTFADGDKVFYNYQSTVSFKSDGTASGSNKYQITGGTGKMKSIKGAGTCKLACAADGGTDYSCEGEYTLAAAAPAKSKN